MLRRVLLVASAIALSVGPTGVWSLQSSAGAAAGDPFTCRASALRVDPDGPLNPLPVIEPIVANGANNPCTTQNAGVLNNQALPGGLGNASVLFARTTNGPGSTAQSGVASVTLTVPGAPVITADVLTARAAAGACTPGDRTPPTLTSSSQVLRVSVGSQVIEPVSGPQTVPLGPAGNLFLNQQTFSAQDGATQNNTVTQRALFLDTPLADVVVAEAIADFRGNPCDTGGAGGAGGGGGGGGSAPPQCSDELDNDGDGRVDFPNDPGCASPQDDDEANSGNEPECSDGRDNDGDGFVDFPEDPGCESRADDDERDRDQPECSDGIDNDGDGAVDFPADRGCKSPTDDDEAAGFVNGGGGYDEVDRKTPPEDTVTPGDSLRFGAVLPCDLGDRPGPNLVTTFLGNGNEAQFKLDELTRAFCRNDPFIDPRNPQAEFDTYVGEGTGTVRVAGATLPARAEFILIDRGEPGSPPVTGIDVYQIRVFVGVAEIANGCCTLDEGNIQVHSPQSQRTAGTEPAPSKGNKA